MDTIEKMRRIIADAPAPITPEQSAMLRSEGLAELYRRREALTEIEDLFEKIQNRE